jgi:hypothetical protein
MSMPIAAHDIRVPAYSNEFVIGSFAVSLQM